MPISFDKTIEAIIHASLFRRGGVAHPGEISQDVLIALGPEIPSVQLTAFQIITKLDALVASGELIKELDHDTGFIVIRSKDFLEHIASIVDE